MASVVDQPVLCTYAERLALALSLSFCINQSDLFLCYFKWFRVCKGPQASVWDNYWCLIFTVNNWSQHAFPPRMGSGAVRIGPLRFLTGGSKSRTKSGFRLFCQLGQFFSVSLLCFWCICSVVFDCFWLTVTVQLIARKDSSPISYCVEWDVKPYTLTHYSCYIHLSTVTLWV